MRSVPIRFNTNTYYVSLEFPDTSKEVPVGTPSSLPRQSAVSLLVAARLQNARGGWSLLKILVLPPTHDLANGCETSYLVKLYQKWLYWFIFVTASDLKTFSNYTNWSLNVLDWWTAPYILSQITWIHIYNKTYCANVSSSKVITGKRCILLKCVCLCSRWRATTSWRWWSTLTAWFPCWPSSGTTPTPSSEAWSTSPPWTSPRGKTALRWGSGHQTHTRVWRSCTHTHSSSRAGR